LDPLLQLLIPFVTVLVTLVERSSKAKIRRNRDAAAYFEALASAMEDVLEGLRARRVPRIEGHEMEALIRAFPKRTKAVLDASESDELKAALDDVARIAKDLDKQVFFHQPSVEADREQMLAQIERILGSCNAMAKLLKPAD
jgi:hypothetical protein